MYYENIQLAVATLNISNEIVTDAKIMGNVFKAFEKHLDLKNTYRGWDKEPANNQTWPQMKEHFSLEIQRNQSNLATLC